MSRPECQPRINKDRIPPIIVPDFLVDPRKPETAQPPATYSPFRPCTRLPPCRPTTALEPCAVRRASLRCSLRSHQSRPSGRLPDGGQSLFLCQADGLHRETSSTGVPEARPMRSCGSTLRTLRGGNRLLIRGSTVWVCIHSRTSTSPLFLYRPCFFATVPAACNDSKVPQSFPCSLDEPVSIGHGGKLAMTSFVKVCTWLTASVLTL